MPFVTSRGFDTYYERSGRGPRLLFLTGSGMTVERSGPLVKPFTASFDAVAPDYRGMGRSGRPPGPYGMADCAADALAVMDGLGWDAARVIGISFGGMVAQELAVTAPGRVERLALLCTSPGGAGGSSYPLHELDRLAPAERSRDLRALIDVRFDDEWLSGHPGDRQLLEVLAGRTSGLDRQQQRAASEQLAVRSQHDVWHRLPRIACPTFIACGRYDGIAPPANSAAISTRVEGSRLFEYEGGHVFFVQDARAVPAVVAFLAEPVAPG
ncbi:MAG: alpha/beta fold hydrolase [Acidimicrobiales bacterium]